MADRKNNDRANLGEQTSNNESIEDPAIERTHRDDMEAGDAGKGGSTERESNEQNSKTGDKMRESSSQHTTKGQSNDRQQGRESTDNNGGSFGGQGGQREGTPNPEGTGYTNDTSEDTGDFGNPLN